MNLLPSFPPFSNPNVVLSETRNLALNSLRLVFLLGAIFTSAIASSAATFVVTKLTDTNDFVCNSDCSLREAVSNANSDPTNDTIIFDPSLYTTAPAVLNLTDHITLANNGTLVVNGPGAHLITLDAGFLFRIFTIQTGSDITLNGITLTKGTGRGGNVFVTGGAIYNPVATLTINNSVVSNSGARGIYNESRGGGIYNAGNLTLNNSTIDGNASSLDVGSGNDGGGIHNAEGATININNSIVSNNMSPNREGGGMYNTGNVTTVIQNSLFIGNRARRGGGLLNNGGSISIAGTTFRGNQIPNNDSGADGGGISNRSGVLNVANCLFEDNLAPNGGGVGNTGIASISESTFRGNGSEIGRGGGIYNAGAISLVDLVVRSNSSGRGGGISSSGTTLANRIVVQANTAVHGGGIYTELGNHTFENSVVSGHTVVGDGGGISLSRATLNLSNTTVTGNTSANSGGGIHTDTFMGGSSTINLSNVTVANNAALAFGGVFCADFSTVNARNSLIAGNRNTTTAQFNSPDFYGKLTSQGYNLIGSTLNATILGVTTGNIINKDPQLVTLRNNGGTTETVALQATSPAIDAGDPNNFLPNDQRGIPRAQDGDLNGTLLPDIGAYERQVVSLTVTRADDVSDGVCDSECSLREAISTLNGATTPDNAIVFSPSVFASPRTIPLTGGELVISNSPTFFLKGPGSQLLTITGNDQGRVLAVRDTSNVAISGVTITGGNGTGAINSGFGGGVYTDARFLNIANSTITGNTASSGGGIAGFNSNTLLFVTNSTVSDNNASVSAAGILNNDSSATKIFNSTIASNVITTENGIAGGIYNRSSLTVQDSIVDANVGGGIVSSGSLQLTGSIVRNNRTLALSRDGGGLHNSGAFSVSGSTISGNTAINSGSGGGIYHVGGSGSITSSTISGNSAGSGAGVFTSSPFAIAASTIAFNVAEVRGGGVSVPSPNAGVPTSRSSIISENTALNSGPGPDYDGTLNSQSNNLIRNISGTTIIGNMVNVVGQAAGIDPMLRLNGGNTPTHALLFGSPARDAGANLALSLPNDQRGPGFARVFDLTGVANAVDGTDIGAYEAQLNPIGAGLEGDAAPRPSGDGILLSTDVTQMRRFVAGLDAPTPGTSEGQRSDCAPRASGGDGIINSSDVVQVRRYVAGLDPLTPTGGPNRPSFIYEMLLESSDDNISLLAFKREINIGAENTSLSSTLRVPVEMTLTGQEVAISFTLEYDPSVVSNPRIALGEGISEGAVLTVNSTQNGRLGILIDSTAALAISKGATNVVVITFDSTSDAERRGTMSFSDSVAARSVSDSNGNALKARWIVGKVH